MSLFDGFSCYRIIHWYCRDKCGRRVCWPRVRQRNKIHQRPRLVVTPAAILSRLSAQTLLVGSLPWFVVACHAPIRSPASITSPAPITSPTIAEQRHSPPAPVRTAVSIIPTITSPLAVLPAPVTQGPITPGGALLPGSPILPGGLYTVSVNRVPASEVLFSLARDSNLDMSVNGEIEGKVSLNVVNQPIAAILDRLQKQVPIRYSIKGHSVTVSADTPFVKSYRVDYLNISRRVQSSVSLATQIGSLKTSVDEASRSDRASNGSTMQVHNESENRFWDSLVANIAGVINDSPLTIGGSQPDADNIFVNRESGILTVRATSKQHQFVDTLIAKIVGSAQRQVLIEATVVEVTLNNSFESGVDWRMLDNNGGTAIDFAQLLTGSPQASTVTTPKTSILSYRNNSSGFGDVSATLKLLHQFGDVQVLSNPKIIALNNQPAVLKVVDNRVYFSFEIDRLQRENGDERTVVDSTIHSVPVGLVMSVTPFINDSGEVILNVRPTISRILNFATDPSPTLAGQSEVQNLIPEIQVREMESLLRVQSGDVAIIGGLMQNRTDDRTAGVPLLSALPLIGKVFSQSNKNNEKTELLVFLRPTVLQRNSSEQYGTLLEQGNMQQPFKNLPIDESRSVHSVGPTLPYNSRRLRTAFPSGNLQ